MLASKLLSRETVFTLPNETNIGFALRQYRRGYLARIKVKQGYTRDVQTGTPMFLRKQFAALERKIKGQTLFTPEVKQDYFSGIKMIFDSYYDARNVCQGVSKRQKEIMRLAAEYVKNHPWKF